MTSKIKHGSIVWVDFGDLDGKSVQKGKRPAICISNKKSTFSSQTLNVIPLTSQCKRNIPVHVAITNPVLDKPSFVLPEQIATIDKTQVCQCVGQVSNEELQLIKKAVAMQLGIKN